MFIFTGKINDDFVFNNIDKELENINLLSENNGDVAIFLVKKQDG